ncbi:MAG: DNA sulfur modification protein DndD [Cyanophyceae cyanobacterium]
MIFKELILENFGPYAGRNVIKLHSGTEDSRPIVLFGGMNGGGKTTLMDAVRLALYGQRAQCSTRNNLSYSDFLTQSVNNQTSPVDKARIELAIEHIRNDQWVQLKIVRTWTRNPKDGKDTLGILEEEWPDTALANTWDEYIETLLPLGISNLFLFDGEQVKELAELEAPPPSVVEAIQSLLGLELAERLAVDLDILVSRKRKALANVSQRANLEEIEKKIKSLTQEKENVKEELAALQAQLERAQAHHRETASKFRLEGGKIAAERSQLEEKIRTLNQAAENQRQELCQLAADVLPLQLISPLLAQAQKQATAELKQKQAEVAQTVLQERDDRLINYLDELDFTSTQIEQIQVFLTQENEALNREANTTQIWLGVDAEAVKRLELVENQLLLQVKQAQEQLDKLKYLEAESETNEKQLAIAASPEAYQKLDEALQKAQQKLVNCQAAYEAVTRKYSDIEKAIAQTKKELEKYSEQAIDRQNNEHIIHSAAKVQQTLKQFKERLTLKKLNKLEGEVTECFRYLLHKSDLVHRVAIESDRFALSLFDPQGQPVPKHRLSAGEKQLLAIAFLWGLARVSGRNLPVAIDTPLGRLDSSHRNNLVERYFPTASHQVILLSTDTEIDEKEVKQLRKQEAIAAEYLLKYDSNKRQTTVEPGYFW